MTAEDGAEKDASLALHQALIHAPGNGALTHCVCCRCFDNETGTVGTNDLFPLDRYALVFTGSSADDPRSARDQNCSTMAAENIAIELCNDLLTGSVVIRALRSEEHKSELPFLIYISNADLYITYKTA